MDNNEEEVSVTKSDEFYEKIEAPKFVDFTVPDRDRYRPDDRYWFCSRVGCDQKHEEELDPEAIYKNFVLRVMAARSPNVRLQKTLNKKCSSANVKCPQSAPAKSSKSKVSRVAMISSISCKISYEKVNVKPIAKAISTRNAKTTQSSIATPKALTTPRNKRFLPNQNSFRSVQNPKSTTVAVPKKRVIAKTLVFNSPKKVVKTKFSVGVDTSVKRVCEGIKKLDMTSQSRRILGYSIKLSREFRHDLHKSLLIETSSKKLKGNFLRGALKEKRKGEKLEKIDNSVLHEHDFSDMEIDEKSRYGSIEVHSINLVNESEEISANVAQQEVFVPLETFSEENVDAGLPIVHTPSEKDNEEEIKPKLEKGKVSDVEIYENQPEEIGRDNEDKENASVSDDNRELNLNTRTKLVAKNETCENVIQKKNRTMMKSTVKAVPEVKYKKPKATNPKPFRLRTDERCILKEAIMEKKLHLFNPSNEASSALRLPLANSQKRHETDIQGNEKIHPGQNKCDNYTNDGSEKQENNTTRKKLQEVRMTRKVSSINEVERRTKTAPTTLLQLQQLVSPQGPNSTKKAMVFHKNPSQLSVIEETLSKLSAIPAARKPGEGFRGRRPATIPRGPNPTRKAMVFRKNPGQLSTIEETSSKLSAIPAARKPGEGFRGRRPATIPRGPNSHSIHTPKNCTKQLVA